MNEITVNWTYIDFTIRYDPKSKEEILTALKEYGFGRAPVAVVARLVKRGIIEMKDFYKWSPGRALAFYKVLR